MLVLPGQASLEVKMKTEYKFNHGDGVRLVGKDNPFRGELGEFIMYDSRKLEKERLIVILHSDGQQHYFYKDEIELMSKYLEFNVIEEKTKTKVIEVISKRTRERLGAIMWFGRWRQYAFFPDNETVFNTECLNDIQSYIRELR